MVVDGVEGAHRRREHRREEDAERAPAAAPPWRRGRRPARAGPARGCARRGASGPPHTARATSDGRLKRTGVVRKSAAARQPHLAGRPLVRHAVEARPLARGHAQREGDQPGDQEVEVVGRAAPSGGGIANSMAANISASPPSRSWRASGAMSSVAREQHDELQHVGDHHRPEPADQGVEDDDDADDDRRLDERDARGSSSRRWRWPSAGSRPRR